MFRFLGVPDGDYLVDALIPTVGRHTSGGMNRERAFVELEKPTPPDTYEERRPLPPSGPTLWASELVSVRHENVQVHVVLRPGGGAAGHLVFEGSREKPSADQLNRMFITLESARGRTTAVPPGPVARDQTFRAYGVPPGEYLVAIHNAPSGWWLTSAQYDDHDISDWPVTLGSDDIAGIVISFTDTPNHLSGTVRDSSGAPVANAFVVAFRADQSAGAWAPTTHIGRTKTGRYGTYVLTGLPPGEYCLVALQSEPDDWRQQDVLATLSISAQRVRVTAASNLVKDLSVSK
jgi:hypothetical protein